MPRIARVIIGNVTTTWPEVGELFAIVTNIAICCNLRTLQIEWQNFKIRSQIELQ